MAFHLGSGTSLGVILGHGGLAAPKGPKQQGAHQTGRGAVRIVQGPLVDVLDGQPAAQHLHKDSAELAGGEGVEEGVDHRAEVEKGVGDRVEGDVGPEVGQSPLGFGLGRRHQPTDLIGYPASCKSPHN